ncbi:DUF3486 family protein [Rhizobium pusense]|uniref:phage protein Gp27 family protein n=1 Tax=Agrobacterium pusense TaxID=648995 RepID=UPI0024473916|nr:DUF3486 family protein [Agrobacterium pusense]MDH1097424.1 DUF3486 family protein [Agrobacterium pusense]MDH1111254.1 DUF3486 family protein [Agrobacterium pusense]MDH2193457.1 DUF3486 family protein [Agrobacterium pusense]
MSRKGRGWLSSIDKLPEECGQVVAWAAKELSDRDRTQIDIYKEFKEKLESVRDECGLTFEIPHYRSFSRYSVNLAALSETIEQARQIATTLADRFDAAGSDDLTIVAAEALKALVLQAAITASSTGKLTSKALNEYSSAVKNLNAAQAMSANRRIKVEAEESARQAKEEMAAKTKEAIQTVAKVKGLSAETTQEILSEILGVKTT